MPTDVLRRNEVRHREDLVADLRRLVEAIDRRVPRLERRDEAAIATDAAALRRQAVAMITTLVETEEHMPPAVDARRI
jgi:hypothetical protein